MKQTEIGLIPDDWEVKRLGELCSFHNGVAHEDYVDDNGEFILVNSKFISSDTKSKKYSKKQLLKVEENTILMVMSDVPNGKAIAKCFLVPSKFQGTLNQRICMFSEFKMNREFAYRIINRNPYYLSFDDGIKQTNLRKIDVLNCPIPLPPLPEQQRIAKALSDVDALISTTEKLLQKKRNIKQGTMQELLTGKKRLPGFAKSNNTKMTELGEIPEDWEVKSLGEICVINPASSNIIPDEFFYVDLESVSSGKLGKKQRIRRRNAPSRAQRQFEKNDILYQTVRPYQRNNLFVNFDSKNYIASTGYAIIRSNNNVDSHYIYQIIHLNNFVNIILDNCTGTSYPAINPKFLKTIPVIIPKKEEQAAIANVLSSMDKEIETLNTKLEKYRNLKNAMMQQLLTGKIRLGQGEINDR